MSSLLKKNENGLRVIRTLRTLEEINNFSKGDSILVFRKIQPSLDIKSKFCLVRNFSNNEFEVICDRRSVNDEMHEVIIDWSFFYPHNWDMPFAAYLIPHDIVLNEHVFIEDLIEDIVGPSWNQGDVYRLDCSEAVWNGKDLVLIPSKRNLDLIFG